MRIKNIQGQFAQVESGHLVRSVNIQMLPGVKIGEYVMVHAGFAIEKLDPEKARETLRLIDEIPLETFSKRQKEGGF
jgi:hydrogenase expression/formation protein HypC